MDRRTGARPVPFRKYGFCRFMDAAILGGLLVLFTTWFTLPPLPPAMGYSESPPTLTRVEEAFHSRWLLCCNSRTERAEMGKKSLISNQLIYKSKSMIFDFIRIIWKWFDSRLIRITFVRIDFDLIRIIFLSNQNQFGQYVLTAASYPRKSQWSQASILTTICYIRHER